MIYEQGSRVIVMTTKEEENGRVKCHGYWPKSAESPVELPEQGIVVSLVSESTCSESACIVRTLTLSFPSSARAPRQVTHIQFTGWPDHGVPASPASLLRVVRLANSVLEGYVRHHLDSATAVSDIYPGPMVVHCSAGVGRSGTFCVVDAALGMLGIRGFGVPPRPLTEAEAAEISVPPRLPGFSPDDPRYDHVYEIVEHFRLQRPLTVQTPGQFIYCYAAVKQAWTSSGCPPTVPIRERV
ncbi:MAG: protein-tyrosine phosphatase-like protein [Olpidium bornovanus]|uniref:Protein-tyrosine phosphatase-like protein n=1 Tax=Olpidium bornovanus TaxID=278681 RepID=A0A8H7ZVM1_9FUNG|nr:MAG: protein-tyrosine phosphatase-like protein [Olpidium bornovanus]